jgi:hypothetical protein
VSGMLYGLATPGGQALVFVGPSDVIPEGFSSRILVTDDRSISATTVESPFGTFAFRSGYNEQVAQALEEVAGRVRRMAL